MNYIHISARVLNLPPKGVDEDVDKAIRQGQIRKVQDIKKFDEKGRQFRVGVEKGTTFAYPEGRAEHRRAALAARRAA